MEDIGMSVSQLSLRSHSFGKFLALLRGGCTAVISLKDQLHVKKGTYTYI